MKTTFTIDDFNDCIVKINSAMIEEKKEILKFLVKSPSAELIESIDTDTIFILPEKYRAKFELLPYIKFHMLLSDNCLYMTSEKYIGVYENWSKIV